MLPVVGSLLLLIVVVVVVLVVLLVAVVLLTVIVLLLLGRIVLAVKLMFVLEVGWSLQIEITSYIFFFLDFKSNTFSYFSFGNSK